MKMLQKALFAIILLGATNPAWAAWKYGETADTMSDRRCARSFAEGESRAGVQGDT